MTSSERETERDSGWMAAAGEILAACEHDAEGTIFNASARLARLLGYVSAAEIADADLFSFYVNGSDPPHILSLLDVAEMTEPVDICLRRADGRFIWVLQSSGYISAVGRRRIFTTFMDITDRKVTELLQVERSEAEAILSRAVADELMGSTDVGSLIRSFATSSAARPESAGLPEGHAGLSPRELRVLVMTGQGKSLKEIASELGISLKSVSTYRARVTTKLQLKTSADLVAYVVRHRLK